MFEFTIYEDLKEKAGDQFFLLWALSLRDQGIEEVRGSLREKAYTAWVKLEKFLESGFLGSEPEVILAKGLTESDAEKTARFLHRMVKRNKLVLPSRLYAKQHGHRGWMVFMDGLIGEPQSVPTEIVSLKPVEEKSRLVTQKPRLIDPLTPVPEAILFQNGEDLAYLHDVYYDRTSLRDWGAVTVNTVQLPRLVRGMPMGYKLREDGTRRFTTVGDWKDLGSHPEVARLLVSDLVRHTMPTKEFGGWTQNTFLSFFSFPNDVDRHKYNLSSLACIEISGKKYLVKRTALFENYSDDSQSPSTRPARPFYETEVVLLDPSQVSEGELPGIARQMWKKHLVLEKVGDTSTVTLPIENKSNQLSDWQDLISKKPELVSLLSKVYEVVAGGGDVGTILIKNYKDEKAQRALTETEKISFIGELNRQLKENGVAAINSWALQAIISLRNYPVSLAFVEPGDHLEKSKWMPTNYTLINIA